MSRRPLPEPPSGFRPGDLIRLALAISFLVLIVLAIVRFRNPATWQWVRNVPQQDPAALSSSDASTSEPETPDRETSHSAEQAPSAPLEVYELGQVGLIVAGGTAVLPGDWAVARWAVSWLSLDALAYATPVADPPLAVKPVPPSRLRYVLPPDAEILRGARDREGFLLEPSAAADNPLFRRERLDADARYHLIALVLEQARASGKDLLQRLHQDARWNVPYELLRDKPHRYRGEVIGLRGTLIWIKRFPLERGGTGGLPEYIYQGVLEQDGLRDRPVWILFTHLPEPAPPEKDWLRLFAPHTVFVGYYLKVVEIEAPPEPPRARPTNKPRPARLYFPVVVGYTVELPVPTRGEDWGTLLLTVVSIVGGIVFISAIALYFYYRSERPYMEKMAQVRERAAQRDEALIEPPERHPGAVSLELPNGNSNDVVLGPTDAPPDNSDGEAPRSTQV
ncbi:MAG: hypothetical protein RMJ19_03510 [Gemmatales bacterium]|nr:hypothetical protein [Gemmatales bacterium]MDW8174713.1 hypothetical protein [Gemmatales bacterium]